MLSEWLDYLRTGLQSTAGDSFFPLLYGVFLFLQLLALYRRFSILKTGGHFWDSYHITGDTYKEVKGENRSGQVPAQWNFKPLHLGMGYIRAVVEISGNTTNNASMYFQTQSKFQFH